MSGIAIATYAVLAIGTALSALIIWQSAKVDRERHHADRRISYAEGCMFTIWRRPYGRDATPEALGYFTFDEACEYLEVANRKRFALLMTERGQLDMGQFHVEFAE